MSQMGIRLAQGHGLMGLTPCDPTTHNFGVWRLQKLTQKIAKDFSYYVFRQPIWGQIWLRWVWSQPRDVD